MNRLAVLFYLLGHPIRWLFSFCIALHGILRQMTCIRVTVGPSSCPWQLGQSAPGRRRPRWVTPGRLVSKTNLGSKAMRFVQSIKKHQTLGAFCIYGVYIYAPHKLPRMKGYVVLIRLSSTSLFTNSPLEGLWDSQPEHHETYMHVVSMKKLLISECTPDTFYLWLGGLGRCPWRNEVII